jgi:hypothetical protein
MKRKISNLTDFSGSNTSTEGEMIQFKGHFHVTEKKGENITILTVLLMSWLIRNIQHEFKASNYMA